MSKTVLIGSYASRMPYELGALHKAGYSVILAENPSQLEIELRNRTFSAVIVDPLTLAEGNPRVNSAGTRWAYVDGMLRDTKSAGSPVVLMGGDYREFNLSKGTHFDAEVAYPLDAKEFVKVLDAIVNRN